MNNLNKLGGTTDGFFTKDAIEKMAAQAVQDDK